MSKNNRIGIQVLIFGVIIIPTMVVSWLLVDEVFTQQTEYQKFCEEHGMQLGEHNYDVCTEIEGDKIIEHPIKYVDGKIYWIGREEK